MKDRLQRPCRPLQVMGVLASVLSTATAFLPANFCSECADTRPIPSGLNLGELGGRLDANTYSLK
jgi:hypothetical protein